MSSTKLIIRIPVMLELALGDSEISEIAERIREDDGRDDNQDITNAEIKAHLLAYASDDFDAFYQDHAPDTHVDEGKTITTEVK